MHFDKVNVCDNCGPTDVFHIHHSHTCTQTNTQTNMMNSFSVYVKYDIWLWMICVHFHCCWRLLDLFHRETSFSFKCLYSLIQQIESQSEKHHEEPTRVYKFIVALQQRKYIIALLFLYLNLLVYFIH